MTSILKTYNELEEALDYTFDYQSILNEVAGSDGYCEFVLDASTTEFKWGGSPDLCTSATVDYGDGTPAETITTFNYTPKSHTYTDQSEDKILKVWLKGYVPRGECPWDVTADQITSPGHSSELYTPQESTACIKGVNRYILANSAVTTLPDYMFGCKSDTDGYYNLETIGDNAIYLKSVTALSTLMFKCNSNTGSSLYLKSIGDYFFRADAIATVSVGGPTYGWFAYCTRLASFGKGAFYFPNATSITFKSYLFVGTTALTGSIRAGFVKSTRSNCSYTFNLTFYNSRFTGINWGAFHFTTTGNVSFGTSGGAFQNCTSLTTIYPESFVYNCNSTAGTMSFGGSEDANAFAFQSCSNLKTIDRAFVLNGSGKMTFGSAVQISTSSGGAFDGCSKLESMDRAFTINGSGTMTFGGTTSSSSGGGGAFANIQSIKKLERCFTINGTGKMEFGENHKGSLYNRQGGAFYSCKGLEEIGRDAFLINGAGSMKFLATTTAGTTYASSSYGGAFFACSGLTVIRTGAFTSKNGSFLFTDEDVARYGVFYQCSSLVTLEPGAFTMTGTGTLILYGGDAYTNPFEKKLVTVANCFNVANTVSWTNVKYLFYNQNYITSALPPLWTRSPLPTTTTGCFFNCTNATNYGSVPATGWK